MGIRFNTNTWRAPLLLIDSWLPAAPQPSRLPHALPRAIQRFARAGWLGRTPPATAATEQRSDEMKTVEHPRQQTATRVSQTRAVRTHTVSGLLRNDARLVISGRIGDVCAELDRLAAIERRATAPQG